MTIRKKKGQLGDLRNAMIAVTVLAHPTLAPRNTGAL
jgi:hypothetical protein